MREQLWNILTQIESGDLGAGDGYYEILSLLDEKKSDPTKAENLPGSVEAKNRQG